ncbi:MAG TPA: glycosyltransferase family 9 protein, partial [Rhizomicrobium sp.]|nr:glycosyltransferase family 9 protein [Rhizomicrobium sp.]
EGWALYESRLQRKDVQKALPSLSQPAWDGEDLRGKKLLVYGEQGFGDLVQFSRYLPQLHALGAELIVQVPKPVLSFISTLRCPMTLIAKGVKLPAFDVHCSIASLPHRLKTTVQTIPGETPYLFSDPEKVKAWQEELGRKTRPRIGLAWSGASRHINDMNRSMPLSALLPLFELPLEWHSLQIEYRPGDLAELNRHPEIRQHQDDLRGFAETAAFVECLDLVITVDSSMAHVAGALGKPVWILLPFSPDYRWMLDRTDSPWYPTARLYRQPAFDDWQSVIANLYQDLAHGLAKQG